MHMIIFAQDHYFFLKLIDFLSVLRTLFTRRNRAREAYFSSLGVDYQFSHFHVNIIGEKREGSFLVKIRGLNPEMI